MWAYLSSVSRDIDDRSFTSVSETLYANNHVALVLGTPICAWGDLLLEDPYRDPFSAIIRLHHAETINQVGASWHLSSPRLSHEGTNHRLQLPDSLPHWRIFSRTTARLASSHTTSCLLGHSLFSCGASAIAVRPMYKYSPRLSLHSVHRRSPHLVTKLITNVVSRDSLLMRVNIEPYCHYGHIHDS